MNLLDEYKKWVNSPESPAGPHDVSELLYTAFEAGFLLGAAPIIAITETKHKGKTLDDFDIWYLPCEKCGYDTGKSRKLQDQRCWRCGSRVYRDYTDRALK